MYCSWIGQYITCPGYGIQTHNILLKMKMGVNRKAEDNASSKSKYDYIWGALLIKQRFRQDC